MNIIQSFNTFDGEFMKGGFRTKRAFKAYLENSFKIHNKLGNYKLYTDAYGSALVNDIIPDDNIHIFDFKCVLNDRLSYIGKFQVQEIQTEPYIHVDLDATLLEMPKNNDVYIEKYRPCYKLGREANNLKIKHDKIFKIPCSGLIGFSNMEFQSKYIKEIYNKLIILKEIPNITYEYAYTLEEVLLERLIIDNSIKVTELKNTHEGHRK